MGHGKLRIGRGGLPLPPLAAPALSCASCAAASLPAHRQHSLHTGAAAGPGRRRSLLDWRLRSFLCRRRLPARGRLLAGLCSRCHALREFCCRACGVDCHACCVPPLNDATHTCLDCLPACLSASMCTALPPRRLPCMLRVLAQRRNLCVSGLPACLRECKHVRCPPDRRLSSPKYS